jgi:hypothetical protein
MSASVVGNGFTYEISEKFHWLDYVDEFYDASIATKDGEIISITLDDFVQFYTVPQATVVARCLFEALATIKHARPDLSLSAADEVRKNTYEDAFNQFAPDRFSATKSQKERPILLTSVAQPNYLYMAVGEFSDPEPMIELCDGEDAVYDMIVASETGDSLEMSFGWFRTRFTKEQALWLWFHLSIAANCLGQHRWVGVI